VRHATIGALNKNTESFMRTLLLTAALVAPMAAWADDNLLVNGSFEATAQANGSWNVYSAIPGWTANPAVEIRDNVVGKAEDGSNYAELDANVNGSITQSFATVAGTEYTLSFWYSNRTDTAVATNGISFGLGGGWIAAPALAANNSGDNLWSQVSYNFVAGSNLTTLSFMATGTNDSYGTSLDNVSVTAAVPEPSTYALMFGGLAAVGFIARRRRPR
jgi:hypothetical protein